MFRLIGLRLGFVGFTLLGLGLCSGFLGEWLGVGVVFVVNLVVAALFWCCGFPG